VPLVHIKCLLSGTAEIAMVVIFPKAGTLFSDNELPVDQQGGVLILEPQPWKSYEKKKWVTEVARENFRNIVIRPDLFSAFLLDKIGFKSCVQITQDVPDCSAGFSRPLFLYTK
jgi:hypothetical protein